MHKLTKITLAVMLTMTANMARAATTPDPGDYTALPAGTNLSMVYAQQIRADDVYAGGNKVALPRDLDLNVKLGLFRQVHFMKLGGYTIDPQIIIPYATQKNGLADTSSTGIGDVIFGGTLWTIADLAGGEHLGYSVFVTAPTGAEKNKGFAISDNRWAADFQVGYIKNAGAQMDYRSNWTDRVLSGPARYRIKQRRNGACVCAFALPRQRSNPSGGVAALHGRGERVVEWCDAGR